MTTAAKETRTHGLTEQQVQDLKRAMALTWDAIAADIFASTEQSVMSQDDVVEVVLDADHLETYGEGFFAKDRRAELRATFAQFRRLPVEQQDEIAYAAFPFKRYGR